MKRLTAIILSLILIISMSIPVIAAVIQNNYKSLIKEQEERMTAAHNMAEAARSLGYKEDHKVIQIAKKEWEKASKKVVEYRILQEKVWETKRQEYPEATYIWEYLQDYGYNDYICAGIIGNIMVEVGGYTLAIQPNLCSNTYAGMCQWALKYRPEAAGLSLEEQCIFLTDTIEGEFATFAWIYQSGFDYEAFKSMTDCEDAALAFAKVYERCGSGSYSLRQECALTAYDYFIGDNL